MCPLNKRLSVQYSIDCKYNVVQHISTKYLFYLTNTLHPLINDTPPLPSLWQPLTPLFESINMAVLGTSYKWNYAVGDFL